MDQTLESVPCRPLRSRNVKPGIWRRACNPASPSSFPPIESAFRLVSTVSRSRPTSVSITEPTSSVSSVVIPAIWSRAVSLTLVPCRTRRFSFFHPLMAATPSSVTNSAKRRSSSTMPGRFRSSCIPWSVTRVSDKLSAVRAGKRASLRRSASETQLARKSTPVTLPEASRMAVPPASSIHCESTEPTSAAGAAITKASSSKGFILAGPPVWQSRIAVEDDPARRQSLLQLVVALLRNECVIQIQRR